MRIYVVLKSNIVLSFGITDMVALDRNIGL